MPIYVQHETLDRIPDVFNAEAIWQAPGFSLFSRRPLLRDLLERSPREQRGRAATRCFSHITLRLPQEDVDDDYHLTRGNRARELAETLAALHQKDFGDLLGSDQVRYGVAGADDLAPGEIQVCFGHAVYLPAADEKALFNVSASRDSAVWKPVCAVYPNQRLALIGGAEGAASVIAPGWPFAGEGAILLVNDGPDSEPVVQMRPKDAFDCQFDASLGAYAIRAKHGTGERLLLKITRALGAPRPAPRPVSTSGISAHAASAGGARFSADQPGASCSTTSGNPGGVPATAGHRGALRGAMSDSAAVPQQAAKSGAGPRPAVWQSRASAPVPSAPSAPPAYADELTAVPVPAPAMRPRIGESDATFAPGALQRMSLVALALPRLSRYRSTGAIALEIPFTSALTIARTAGAERAITFVATEDDELYAVTPAGRERITAPASFTPTGSRALRLQTAPQAMAERYSYLLSLAEACSQPLIPGARATFGRGIAPTAALRPLDAAWMLASTTAGSSPDRIGLSRNAFTFEAAAGALSVSRLSSTQALYHLDDKLQFVAAISDDKPYTIPPGHHIVAGHYVLRFDA
ncbi:hypothetical protein [Pseudoduganella sp. RAF53_2]|uniref:hypothetical protein n=1 Tax=unclassified Pseudoduganella TaxID=2637179 RepID=UPI003F959603